MSSEFVNTSDYSASASLSGYLYQCLFALLESVKKIKQQTPFSVWIEFLDDVTFEITDNSLENFQTKHHLNQKANLTDSSPDLWKTIRIWCDFVKNNQTNQNDRFYLVTTSQALPGSVGSFLTSEHNRDVRSAILFLDAVASTSVSKTNRIAYETYKKLSNIEKENLFNSVFILDQSATINDIQVFIKQELYYASELRYLDSLLSRLLGWWIRRVIRNTTDKPIEPILSDEIVSEITLLREQFKTDNLPIDDDILESSIRDAEFQDRQFVKQLRLINVEDKRIFNAIKEYYRAFTQRSRWVREDLLLVGELDRYEQRLCEEWENRFEEMREDLGEKATEEEKIKAARVLYKWVEQSELFRIRDSVNDPCIPRGSYHILADDTRIGWHTEFKDRLRAILEA